MKRIGQTVLENAHAFNSYTQEAEILLDHIARDERRQFNDKECNTVFVFRPFSTSSAMVCAYLIRNARMVNVPIQPILDISNKPLIIVRND